MLMRKLLLAVLVLNLYTCVSPDVVVHPGLLNAGVSDDTPSILVASIDGWLHLLNAVTGEIMVRNVYLSILDFAF